MVAPTGWKEVRLGEHAAFFKGNGLSKSQLIDDGPQQCVHYGELFTHYGPVIETVTSKCVAFEGSFKSLAGDVLMPGSDVTPRGLATASAIKVSDVVLGGDVIVIRTKPTSLHGPFLSNFIRMSKGRVLRLVKGSTVYHIHAKDLADLEVLMPPLKEQEAIAEALSDADAAIESLDALIAKKRDVKQATMQQLLTGRTRLPGFTVDWKKTELRSVLKFQVGFPFSSQSFAPNGIGIRLIRNADLKSASSAVSIVGAYPEEFAVQSGDLLIGMDGDFAPIIWKGGFALLNQRVGRVICGPEMSKGYARYELASHLKEIEIRTGATTVKHLSHDDVALIVLQLPPLKEQEAIAEVLTVMDDELEALTEQVSKLRMIKEGMMQDLLTGKVRLV